MLRLNQTLISCRMHYNTSPIAEGLTQCDKMVDKHTSIRRTFFARTKICLWSMNNTSLVVDCLLHTFNL